MPKDSQNICDELKSTVVCRDSHIKFGKALLSFAHWNSMNPLYHGTTHNKYSPTEWSTNSSYAPPFYAPSSRTMTPPVHTTSPATYTTSTRLSPPQKRKRANDDNSATSTASNHASAKIREFLAGFFGNFVFPRASVSSADISQTTSMSIIK